MSFHSSSPQRVAVKLANRQNDECGSDKAGYYNTPLHVIALFIILILSTVACSFPILARRFPRLPIPRRFLFISRHFGTGVLIATAFVHLLPTAFNSLTNPCLPRFWNKGYPAMAGFIAMLAVFLVVVVEMFFAMKGAKHIHGKEYDELIGEIGLEEMRNGFPETADDEYLQLDSRLDQNTSSRHESYRGNTAFESAETGPGYDSHDKDDDDLDLEELDPYSDETHSLDPESSPRNIGGGGGGHQRRVSESIPLQNPQKQLLQCLLLEAGILFHSIFIGMALSVATGTSFIVLLVAISFHQTFEGFALGSRIASLIPGLFPPSSLKPWLMACAYGTTTPIGQALGLFLHNLYDPASTMGLLMVGFTNAISSGLLLFAGLVELLAEDFLSDSSYESLRGKRRVEACLAVLSGALLMSMVGAFA
ncbi:Zinc-regulated transporter 2 [Talaromyces islandicus]|uniref:Zinc-regulated transporter 2 n=1 Tax=Talaromyces islandicus TaxID=28573 RepID=A0A0U1M9G8_TALIS|nr:Zinc-regulated transporter 2 [Talaromyces islandicus]